MISNYVPAEWKEEVYYELIFDDGYHNGFCFPCTEDGEPMLTEFNKENYEFCMANPEKFVRFNKVLRCTNRYLKPASGTCGCGEEIYLCDEYMGACQCPECGQWYNLFGQRLNPPSSWEERLEEDY